MNWLENPTVKLFTCFTLLVLISSKVNQLHSERSTFFNKFKSKFHKPFKNNSQSTPEDYILIHGQSQIELIKGWDFKVDSPLIRDAWIGTTYKEIPYTEQEFINLRDKIVEDKVLKLKLEHIAREKAKKKESQENVDDLLSSFLGEDEEKGEDSKKAENQDYLANFREDEVRKRVVQSTYVPQSRSVLTKALYFQLENLNLYCLDAETGMTTWVTHLPSAIERQPFETEKYLSFILKGTAYLVDKKSGYIKHRSKLDRAILPHFFEKDGRFFFGSFTNRVVHWNPIQNYPLKVNRLVQPLTLGVFGDNNSLFIPSEKGILLALEFSGKEKWSFINQKYSEDKIYLESIINKLFKEIENERSIASKEERKEDAKKINKIKTKIEKVTAKIQFLEHQTRGQYISPPVVFGDYVYIGSTDFNLYQLNRHSGLLKWKYNCQAPITRAPLVSKKLVWLTDKNGNLHKINAENGKGQLLVKNVSSILHADDTTAIFRTGKNRVSLFIDVNYYTLSIKPKDQVLYTAKKKALIICRKNSNTLNQFFLPHDFRYY